MKEHIHLTTEEIDRLNQADETAKRERLIEDIERYSGALQSVPYHMISTKDLKALLEAIKTTWS